MRHFMPLMEKLFSSILFIDWIMSLNASAIDLRIAGPIMGNMASTRGLESFFTLFSIAFSMTGNNESDNLLPDSWLCFMARWMALPRSIENFSGSSIRSKSSSNRFFSFPKISSRRFSRFGSSSPGLSGPATRPLLSLLEKAISIFIHLRFPGFHLKVLSQGRSVAQPRPICRFCPPVKYPTPCQIHFSSLYFDL